MRLPLLAVLGLEHPQLQVHLWLLGRPDAHLCRRPVRASTVHGSLLLSRRLARMEVQL